VSNKSNTIVHPKDHTIKKRLPWDKRINLLLAGLILAAAIKVLINTLVDAPMPPPPFPEIGGNFTLESTRGPVTQEVLLDKVTVIYFGYTHCPDICPTTLNNIATAFRMLHESKDLDKTRGMFITLDPERDNTTLMDNFAEYFHKNIKGLSGSGQQITHISDRFKIGYEKEMLNNSPDEYAITHTGYLYIMRPDGQIGELLGHSSTPQKIVEAIHHWLPWAS